MSITIYTRSTCSPCKTVKKYLKYKGLKYLEKSVDNIENAKESFKLSGAVTVPVVVIGEKVVVGPNLSLIAEYVTI